MAQRAGTKANRNISLDALVNYLGRYFQIRDDYMNLTAEVCTKPIKPLHPNLTQV